MLDAHSNTEGLPILKDSFSSDLDVNSTIFPVEWREGSGEVGLKMEGCVACLRVRCRREERTDNGPASLDDPSITWQAWLKPASTAGT